MPRGIYSVQLNSSVVKVEAASKHEAMQKVREMGEDPKDAVLIEFIESPVEKIKSAYKVQNQNFEASQGISIGCMMVIVIIFVAQLLKYIL